MAPIHAAVDKMPATVTNAATAIEADCTDEYKSVKAAVRDLTEIHSMQLSLYKHVSEDDRRACGDQTGLDPMCRLYFFRRLAEVVPDWRGPSEMPWPADPADRLIWVVRNHLEPWCPTGSEIKQALKSLISEAAPPTRNHHSHEYRLTEPPPHKTAGPIRSMVPEPIVRAKPLRETSVSSVASASFPDTD